MSWVRCRTNRSRVRNTKPAACCRSLFTATNHMLGRCAASQIASASIASFFCRFTNGFYIGGRDQPNFMAKLGKLTSPVMRSTTRLQRYRAIRLRCKEIQQLSSTDPLSEYHSTPLIRSVNMKDVLGDIQTDYDNFRNGRLPQVVLNTSTLAHRCRREASTPS
jgi:hypothetical protein